VWPKRNTAFVIIHGSGPYRPLETLDRFARGLCGVLRHSNPDLHRCWRHKLQRRCGWIEHYLSVAPNGKPVLDFYEYFWDRYMDHSVGLGEVIRWLHQVSDSAKRFYHARPALSRSHEERGVALFKDGDFRVGGYFVHLSWAGRALGWLQPLGNTQLPIVGTVVSYLLAWGSRFMAKMMGDVVIYTTADVRSSSYATRERILAGALDQLKLLLAREDYDQIILVGHSLGSVIAYDLLNRLVLEFNAGGGIPWAHSRKLVGLVTFGSPLDKVAFFFREHTSEDEYVRRQLLAHSHCFKTWTFVSSANPVEIANPVQKRLHHVRWLNFYHLQDPVSGHLDAYDVDRNIQCTLPARRAADAHSAYWIDEQMYAEICSAFFRNRLDAFFAQA
jgi:hypothetical protein